MFAVVQNGEVRQVLQLDVPFSVGDKHYSSNFLRTSSPQEKLEAGVWEIIEGQRPDDRFYWVSGPNYRVNEVDSVVEASFSGTDKNLDDLKKQWTAWVNDTVWALLQKTDFMDSRKANEPEYTPPADWITWRSGIRTQATNAKAAIAAATDVTSLQAAIAVQWNPDPNQQEVQQ